MVVAAPANAAVLTDAQIAGWARNAGFPQDQIATAVAVALAESGGQTGVIGPTGDYGVWQISLYWNPGLFQQYPNWWTETNATMARSIWQEGGWERWSTFTNGKYRLYLGRGEAAAAGTSGDSGGGADVSSFGASGELTDYLVPDALLEAGNAVKVMAAATYKAGQWLGNPNNWVRVAQVGVGAALLIGAMTILARPVSEAIAGPAAAVLTGGKSKAA